MANLDRRIKKLEAMKSGDSIFIILAKVYCECEGITFNSADYPAEMQRLTWADIFGGSNHLPMGGINNGDN